jgi:hypothetical protein
MKKKLSEKKAQSPEPPRKIIAMCPVRQMPENRLAMTMAGGTGKHDGEEFTFCTSVGGAVLYVEFKDARYYVDVKDLVESVILYRRLQ